MEIDVIDVKVGAEVEVEQLIEAVKTGVARASRGKMFDLLRETRSRPERPKLGWVHQLAHMSREFIQALLMRAALCGRRRPADYVFYPPFADHGRAEYRHPIELEEWMERFALVGGDQPQFCAAPMTRQTRHLLAYLWYVAEHAEPAFLGVPELRQTWVPGRGRLLRQSAGTALGLFDEALTSWADVAQEFEPLTRPTSDAAAATW